MPCRRRRLQDGRPLGETGCLLAGRGGDGCGLARLRTEPMLIALRTGKRRRIQGGGAWKDPRQRVREGAHGSARTKQEDKKAKRQKHKKAVRCQTRGVACPWPANQARGSESSVSSSSIAARPRNRGSGGTPRKARRVPWLPGRDTEEAQLQKIGYRYIFPIQSPFFRSCAYRSRAPLHLRAVGNERHCLEVGTGRPHARHRVFFFFFFKARETTSREKESCVDVLASTHRGYHTPRPVLHAAGSGK